MRNVFSKNLWTTRRTRLSSCRVNSFKKNSPYNKQWVSSSTKRLRSPMDSLLRTRMLQQVRMRSIYKKGWSLTRPRQSTSSPVPSPCGYPLNCGCLVLKTLGVSKSKLNPKHPLQEASMNSFTTNLKP
jgi:hypothetical protein